MKHEELKAILLRDEALSRLDVPRGRMEAYADEAARTILQAQAGEQDERDAAVRALLAQLTLYTDELAHRGQGFSDRGPLMQSAAAVRKHYPETRP